MYHTVSLFSEDSMESIYANLDSERKTKAILQSITATKKRSVAMQSIKVSKGDDVGKFLQKQKRRQGGARKSITLR